MFYTYIHRRASDNKPFYVGKGSLVRCHCRTSRSQHWQRVVAKHGLKVEVTSPWYLEEDAFAHERFLIRCFRELGHDLVNRTDGGEGASGMKHPPRSEEWRRKRRASRKLQVFTQETKHKLSQAGLGRKPSVETRARMSESAKKAITPQILANRSIKQMGALNHASKPVICIDTQVVYPSAADAARAMRATGKLKAAKSAISEACRGGLHTAYKLRWAFFKEVPDD